MKNFTKNYPITLQFNKMNSRILNNKVVLKILISFLVLLTYGNSLAQVNNNNSNVKEVTSFLSSLKKISSSDYENVRGLLYDLNPAIYAENNTLEIFKEGGKECTVLFSDMTSLNYIKNNTIPSNSIELVRINIIKTTDLNGKIDLSIFSNFPN